MVSASIAYFAIQLELIRPVIANMPWPSPVGVGAFISTGVTGKQRLSQLSVQFQRLSFARAYDKKLVDEESTVSEEAAGESISA